MNISLYKTLGLMLCLLVLSACGGGGGGGGNVGTSEESRASGVFIDSVVVGLTYTTPTLSGITDANGVFRYIEGETVTFSIGGIIIGSVMGGSIVTPLDLVPHAASVSDDQVLNIARLLQTLDDNGDPDDGITITPAVSAAALDFTVDFSLSVEAFANASEHAVMLAELTALTSAGPRNLVSASDARLHLQDSLFDLSNDRPPVGTLALSGPDVEFVGSRLSAQDIVYGYEAFTGVTESVVMTGRGLDVSDLESPSSAFSDGFLLVALDAAIDVGSALIIQVDSVGYEYACTIDCNIVIDYDNRQISFENALFVNELTSTELRISGSIEWTPEDEVSDNGGGSVGGGADGICDPNIATVVSQQANNAYGFTVNNEECFGVLNPDTERLELPVNVIGAVDGLSFDSHAKLSRSTWTLSHQGLNYTFINWYFSLDLTNHSSDLLCDGVDDAYVMDATGQEVVKINMSTRGNIFRLPGLNFGYTKDCIKPGQTLSLYGTASQQISGSGAPIALANLGVANMTSDFEVPSNPFGGTAVEWGALQANSFEWKYFGGNIGIEASFTNTLGMAIKLEDDTFRVNYFDAQGYLVSREFINRYDALGLDDDSDLQEQDFIIQAGETFLLADDVADIGYAELNPGKAVKAVVYLEWSPVVP